VVALLASAAALPAQDTTRAVVKDTARAVAQDTVRAGTPDSARATPAASATHKVKKGDTLWDLAKQYLSNPYLWPQIHHINTDVVKDPHWIYPGEVLRIPGAAPVVAATDQTATPQTTAADSAVQRTASTTDRSSGPAAPTVFINGVQGRRTVSSRIETPDEYPHTAVRAGEFYAAPWVDRSGGAAGQGRLIASAEIPGIAQASGRSRLLPHERGYVTLPAGTTAAKGDRLLVFAPGAELSGGAQVMQPTGILEVERAAEGEAATVRIVQQFGYVEVGQRVVPLQRFTMSTEARPEPVEGGLESEVTAVPTRAVLPTVGYYVILSATAREGVDVGDVFMLYRPRTSTAVAGGTTATLPEEPIALAQVVKVTERGTTAMIVDQRHPAVKPGVHARLTAKIK
jgi:LysM repeat protein